MCVNLCVYYVYRHTHTNCKNSKKYTYMILYFQCSSSCDVGEQVRDVVCVTTLRGSLRVVLDMNCPANKPENRKSCRERACTSAWFISDWTPVNIYFIVLKF